MEGSDDPTPPASDAPQTHKKKKIVLPKKKKKFTRTLKDKKPTKQEENKDVADVTAETPTTSTILERVTTQGASRRLTRSELAAEVQRLTQELTAAQDLTVSLQREVSTLKKRNKNLSESTTKARADLREERKAASKEQQQNKRKFNELEVRAEQAELDAAAEIDARVDKERVS